MLKSMHFDFQILSPRQEGLGTVHKSLRMRGVEALGGRGDSLYFALCQIEAPRFDQSSVWSHTNFTKY